MTMNADVERLKMLLTETIALLCQRGLTYRRELHVQGLLGITVDGNVFLIPIDERTFSDRKQPPCVAKSSAPCELNSLSQQHDSPLQETQPSAPCRLNSLPQQHDSPVHQVVEPAVHHTEADDATHCQPLPTQHPVVDNNPGLPTVIKSEVSGVDNIDSSTESKIKTQTVRRGSSEYFSASEPESQPFQSPPFQSPCSFPMSAFGYGFGNSTSTAQMPAVCGQMNYEGKRKRKQSTFGDDMLVLSPDNDEWTNSSQREINEPEAGCSHWTNFGDGPSLQRDIIVSI